MFFAREEIAFPADLERGLREAIWNGSPDPGRMRANSAALNHLWEKLAKRRGMAGQGERHYSLVRAEAEAYASYYLPANALKTALVLEEAYLLGMDILGKESDWLDFGTGPGTALWGLSWWAGRRARAVRFKGVDQSPVFTDLAARFARHLPYPAESAFLAESKQSPDLMVRKHSPTHVSFVNSLAEYFPVPERRREEVKKLLAALGQAAREDGSPRYLLIVEPGSRESSRELAELKDEILQEGKFSALLPCPDNRKCGALKNPRDWCHEEVACGFPAWLNELGSEAGLRKESILFSYLLLKAGGEPAGRSGCWRVVSQRLERKGQVECWLCSPEGKISARAQRSRAGEESLPVLEACRGDLWEEPSLGPKGDLIRARRIAPLAGSVFGGKSQSLR